MAEKIRLAILGCGGNSRGHARRMRARSEDVEIVGVCDIREDIVNSYLENCFQDVAEKPEGFTDYDKMLSTLKPDAVLISTPHTLHFEHGMKALEAGCHVFMEKPMVTQVDHAYAIADKVKQTGKIFVVGYNTPCTPAFKYLRDQIRAGTWGRLEIVTGYITQGWKRGTQGTWRQNPALSGGGQAYDSGAHLLNSVCWSVEQKVAETHVFMDNCGTPVDINSTINVRFENGTFAAIAISGNCNARGGSHTAFVFEDARVEIDGWNGQWIRVFTRDGEIEVPLEEGGPKTPDDNFINAILGREEPRTTPFNGIVHSELMESIYRSAQTGLPAKVAQRVA